MISFLVTIAIGLIVSIVIAFAICGKDEEES